MDRSATEIKLSSMPRKTMIKQGSILLESDQAATEPLSRTLPRQVEALALSWRTAPTTSAVRSSTHFAKHPGPVLESVFSSGK